MISLLAPLGLAALAAFALPLAIHWVRRSDRQRVSFAAMRYLREHPHAREQLRLHERLLLLLRLMLIASLAVLLSLPVWRGRSEPQSPWILVAPGIDAAAAHARVAAPPAEWHWLAPGFPALDSSGTAAAPLTQEPVASLVRELDSELAPGTAMTIVVPAELGGLDAERLRLGRPVTWRVLPGRSPDAAPNATPGGLHDAERVANAHSTGADANSPTLTLAVRYDPKDLTELPLVRALAMAWQAEGLALHLDIATRDTPLSAQTAWLIWLGGPIPPSVNAWLRHGGSLLASRQTAAAGRVVLTDDNGAPVLREQQLGAGRVLSLAGPLRASEVPSLAAPDFPTTVAGLLQGPMPAPDRATAESVAPLPPRPHPALVRPQSLAPYLALMIALLFLLERLYATRSRVRKSNPARTPDGASASVVARE